MALAVNRALYEIMVRFRGGEVAGAHVVELETIRDGETLLHEREMPARPIDPAEVGELLGQETAAMFAQISRLTAERDTLQRQAETLQTELDNAASRAQRLEELLAECTNKGNRKDDYAN